MAVGLVTNVQMTLATPTAFAAHVYDRDKMIEIASQMLAAASRSSRYRPSAHRRQRLLQIGNNVGSIFNPDRKAYQPVADADPLPLLYRQAAM